MQNRHSPMRRLISVLLTICLVFTLVPAFTSLAASDYALVRQASVASGYYRVDHTLRINNVDSGTKLDYGYAGLSDVSNPSPVFIKSRQAQIGNYTGSTATLNVDRSAVSNVLNSGMNISLYMANCTACHDNCVRWGVQLWAKSNGATLGTLGNGYRSITVTSTKGTSYTYSLTNSAGTAISGCETSGGDWTSDAHNNPETPYGPYYWYLSGNAPAVGDSVTFRVVGITVARAGSDNYQMHSEWIDLTINGVCKHSGGYASTSTAASHLKSAATCTSPAVYYKSCATCGANGTETFTSGSANAHSYTSQTATAAYLKSAATCLSPAVYYYKCATCTAKGTNTYTSGSALPHSYTGAVRSDGNGKTATHSFKCVNGCDAYGNAAVHTWNAGVVTSQPSCTGTGVKTFTCTVSGCGATYTETVSANGHTMQEILAKAATCLAAGNNKYYKCTVCNKYYTTEDGAAETTPAAQTISQKAHSYTGEVRTNGDGTHSFKCVNGCNEYGGAASCSYEDAVTPASCTAQGFTTHTCTVCGYNYKDTYTDMTAHVYSVYVSEVTPADCEANATATYKCENCDATTVKEVPDTKLGHDFGEWTVTSEAKCETAGEETRYCSRCDEFETRPVTAKGHDYGSLIAEDPATCENDGVIAHYHCADCGKDFDAEKNEVTDLTIAALGHDFGAWTVTTEAKCETAGEETRYCSRCDAFETRPVDPFGHDFGEWTVTTEAKCETAGEETRVCKNDASHTESRTIPAKGHNWSAWEVTKAATCEEDGIETRTCASCGNTETRIVRSSGAAHQWSAWTETKAPTCSETGEQIRTCAVCRKTETKPVAKLAHSWGAWIDDEGSTVTCTSGGTQHRECAVCGEIETRDVPGGLGHHIAHPNLRGEGYCEYCGEFRCNYCDRLEEFEDIDIIGFFYRIVHFFIHFAHMISYHS